MNKIFKTTAAWAMAAALTLSGASVFADFPDMPEDDTRVALENAVENGLLTGYETGEIKPYEKITRAQMAAILVRAMGVTATADLSEFSDMDEEKWYYDSMSKAVAMGAFQGDGENLNPENNITFQEAFAVIARVFHVQSSRDLDATLLKFKKIEELPEYDSSALDEYKDSDAVADWAFGTTLAIVENGYWAPETKELRPQEYINRVEFAVLMDNLIETYIDEAGEYAELPEGNVLVRCGDVTIGKLEGETSNIIIGDNVEGNVNISADVKINRLIMRGGTAVAEDSVFNMIYMPGSTAVLTLKNDVTINTGIVDGVSGAKLNFIKDVG